MKGREWPAVKCPGCQISMGVKKVTPRAPGGDSGEIIYACEICKTETTRLYKAPASTRVPPGSRT